MAIHPTAVIDPGVALGPDCDVGPFCHLQGRVSAGPRNRFAAGVAIGGPPMDRAYTGAPTAVRIGADNVFFEHATVHRATGEETVIGDRNFIMTYVHVAHDCRLGSGCVLTSAVQLGGHVTVGDGANIGGLTGIHQFCRIGRLAMVGACSYVNKDIPPFLLAAGRPCRVRGLNAVGLARAGLGPAETAPLRLAFRLIYRSGLDLGRALREAEQLPGPLVRELVEFTGASRRGIELRGGQDPGVNYPQAVAFLDSLVNYERQARPRDRFKLAGIRRFLALAGNPQRRLPPVILVAGTKGKGSVCYLLEAALRGCGLSTGLFVSPHVQSIRERIQLDGRPVGPRTFAATVERLAPLVRQRPVSYFEFTCAAAFDLFARRRPDWCIIEVGLGGRLDATNLCDPQFPVITRIGYDHLRVLGNTLSKIAGEKAGIMRPGRPAVISAQSPEARRALARSARAVGAALVDSTRAVRTTDIRTLPLGTRFTFSGRLGTGPVSLPLLGRHQVENCRTALAVLGLAADTDPRITAAGARRGIAAVTIPARCEPVRRSPFLLIDSCHNPESGRALARAIRDHLGDQVVLVYGSLAGKLVRDTVRPLAPLVRAAILVAPDSPRALPLALLRGTFTRLGIPSETAPDVPAALALARCRARESSRPPLPVIVAGSFYLAGEARALLRPENETGHEAPRPGPPRAATPPAPPSAGARSRRRSR